MHDPRLSERTSSGEVISPGSGRSSVTTNEQGSFRIDAPHQLGDAAATPEIVSERPDLLTQAFRHPLPATSSEQQEDRVFVQAEQISDYLRTKQQELEQREQRLLGQLALLDQERRSVRLWISQSEEDLDEKQSELEQREQAVLLRENHFRRVESEVEQDRIELLEGLAGLEVRQERVGQAERRLQSDLESIRTEKEREWEARRREIQAEIEEQRRQLESEQEDHQSALDQQRSELRQERQLLENRVRFQLEHLEKMRGEIEEQQREFLIVQQGMLNRNQRHREQLELQQRQMYRFRNLLEEREASLERSWDSLHKTRKAFADNCQDVQGRLDLEQRAWERDQELRQAELQRQHELLTAHAANLEARHLRLDELRSELDGTHRQLLEMRVAIEESTAQLAQALGEVGAKERIETARWGISEHYQKSQESLVLQRREIEQLRTTLQQQREDFLTERASMTEWVKERDDLLKLRETSLRKGEGELTLREATWEKLREFWQTEKLQAERVIRDLLRQLEEQTSQPHSRRSDEDRPT